MSEISREKRLPNMPYPSLSVIQSLHYTRCHQSLQNKNERARFVSEHRALINLPPSLSDRAPFDLNPRIAEFKIAGEAPGALPSPTAGMAGAQLLQFLAAVGFFHGSEYALAVAFHGRSNVTLSSLLITKQYVIAMACALVENMIEILLFPELKNYWWVSIIGLILVLTGEVIRKAAILTAGRAFSHIIRIYHEDHHELITHGIYRFFRHPGYCGFFIWSIGTQVMLCNPVCTVGFAAVTWQFFSKRIPYEEFFLRQFFGPQYIEYARRVPSGLPFIR